MRRTAVDRASAHRGGEGGSGPQRGVAGRDVVEVRVEHHGAPVAPATDEANDVAKLVGPHLIVAQAAHLLLHQGRYRTLFAGHAGRRDEAAGECHYLILALPRQGQPLHAIHTFPVASALGWTSCRLPCANAYGLTTLRASK